MKTRLLVLALGSMLSFGSYAQSTSGYPTKTVRIVVPFAAVAPPISSRASWRRVSPRVGPRRSWSRTAAERGAIHGAEVAKALRDLATRC